MKGKWILWKIGGGLIKLILLAAFALAFGYGVMHLWNWLVPGIFHGPAVGFWQAVGIIVLARLLVGGFGRGGGCGPWGGGWKHRGGWGRHHHGASWQSKRDYWSYYSDYWKERGESDFEAYVKERKEKDGSEKREEK